MKAAVVDLPGETARQEHGPAAVDLAGRAKILAMFLGRTCQIGIVPLGWSKGIGGPALSATLGVGRRRRGGTGGLLGRRHLDLFLLGSGGGLLSLGLLLHDDCRLLGVVGLGFLVGSLGFSHSFRFRLAPVLGLDLVVRLLGGGATLLVVGSSTRHDFYWLDWTYGADLTSW